MIKRIILFLGAIFLVGCGVHDEAYYHANPEELSTALEHCSEKPQKGLSCDELKKVATEVNRLAYELQSNPINFGKKIMDLEIQLAEQKLKNHNKQRETDDVDELAKVEKELALRMAIVKWLESPVS